MMMVNSYKTNLSILQFFWQVHCTIEYTLQTVNVTILSVNQRLFNQPHVSNESLSCTRKQKSLPPKYDYAQHSASSNAILKLTYSIPSSNYQHLTPTLHTLLILLLLLN